MLQVEKGLVRFWPIPSHKLQFCFKCDGIFSLPFTAHPNCIH